MEYIAFHTVASIQTAAKIGFGQQLVLPVGTHAEKELFHGIVRQHAKVASVQGKGLAWYAFAVLSPNVTAQVCWTSCALV